MHTALAVLGFIPQEQNKIYEMLYHTDVYES